MIVTQTYAQRSSATLDTGSLGLNMSTETGRPPVRLHATVRDSLAYARLMKALYAVVTSNLLPSKPDRSAYFEWVRQQYLGELAAQQAAALAGLPALFESRDALRSRLKKVNGSVSRLTRVANSAEFYGARREYYNYLYHHDRDAWYALDPVVSVHPDCLIFEAFSQDESAYGRVTVPMDRLAVDGPVDYGTTNIDFSPDLAREIGRIRSYRPTDLHVGPGQVALATTAGSAVEKKIDLPPTWVRGFLQVQSAATMPGVDVRLSPATLADVLTVVRRRHEDRGPRSLRVVLTPGARPHIVVEPWGTVVREHTHVYDGRNAQEIRIWGRRRLLVLEELLPHAEEVRARLLGTGLPSYWSVLAATSRLDVGLSGWTQNDWSRAAQFDLLASLGALSREQLAAVARALEDRLAVTPQDAALLTGLSRDVAAAALQALTREGRAMYDYVTGAYRWRQLFPFMPEPEAVQEDPRLATARNLIERGAVRWSAPPVRGSGVTIAPPASAAGAVPPLPTAAATNVAINAGGTDQGRFGGDTYDNGLPWRRQTTRAHVSTRGVTDTAPESVYQSENVGAMTYRISGLVTGQPYRVRLHFAEIFWNMAGSRLFDVSINGIKVLSNFDIYVEAGGKNCAIVREFDATAASRGTITVEFSSVRDNAKVSAIEVIWAGAPASAQVAAPTPAAAAGQAPTATVAAAPAPTVTATAAANVAPDQWRTFVFKDASSDKFWDIRLTGAAHEVRFGRRGTDGQRQEKEFATAQQAEASYQKLVKEKTGKGYKETTLPPPAAIVVGNAGGEVAVTAERTRFAAEVWGEKVFNVILDVDVDGRAVYAQCTCAAYRRDKLRKGPCPHILATTVAATRYLADATPAGALQTTGAAL